MPQQAPGRKRVRSGRNPRNVGADPLGYYVDYGFRRTVGHNTRTQHKANSRQDARDFTQTTSRRLSPSLKLWQHRRMADHPNDRLCAALPSDPRNRPSRSARSLSAYSAEPVPQNGKSETVAKRNRSENYSGISLQVQDRRMLGLKIGILISYRDINF